eukprot:3163345-Amphidinium_carterae.1
MHIGTEVLQARRPMRTTCNKLWSVAREHAGSQSVRGGASPPKSSRGQRADITMTSANRPRETVRRIRAYHL